jgi:TRAP-type C4-dicarboxylate transport system substrate-binding protein
MRKELVNKNLAVSVMSASALMLAAGMASAQDSGPPDEVTEWTIQPCFDNSDAGWASGVLPWADAVEKATEGSVQIEVVPAGSITSGGEAFGAAAAGVTDGVACWATVYGGDMPAGMLAFGLPMGAESPEEAWEVMWGDDYRVGDLVQEAASQRNLYFAGWTNQGPNAMFTTFEVRGLADFEGRKMRAGGPQAMFHEAVGGTPVSMDAGDIYTAIRLGTVDGTYWDTGGVDNMSFDEVIDYAVMPGWNPAQHQSTYVNLDSWNALTEWQQDQINGIFEEVYFETSRMHLDGVDEALQAVEDSGGEVVNLADEEVGKLRQVAIEEVWPDIADLSDLAAEGVDIYERYMRDNGKL